MISPAAILLTTSWSRALMRLTEDLTVASWFAASSAFRFVPRETSISIGSVIVSLPVTIGIRDKWTNLSNFRSYVHGQSSIERILTWCSSSTLRVCKEGAFANGRCYLVPFRRDYIIAQGLQRFKPISIPTRFHQEIPG